MSYDYEAARKRQAEEKRKRQAEDRAKKKRARIEKEKKAKKQAKWDAKKKKMREELGNSVNGMLGGDTTPGAYGANSQGQPPAEQKEIRLSRGSGLGGTSRRATPSRAGSRNNSEEGNKQKPRKRPTGKIGAQPRPDNGDSNSGIGAAAGGAAWIKLKRPV